MIKILFYILVFFILFGIIRMLFVVFRFMRFLRKAGAPQNGETKKKESKNARHYPKSDGTITLGKDDYHVE